MVFELHAGEELGEMCVCKLHSIICVHSLAYFHAIVWSRSYRSRSFMKYGTQCGETSTTLAETQSSVSSVGLQSKGSFVVFLVIKISLFPASLGKTMTAVNSF